jgi:alkanesulfonate monooxygenase SsuD/methylene tetrahydromethanopterin reductase-like flavin-dependent oxidoreductase (luciferase family)
MKFGIQHPNYTYDGQGLQVVDSLKELATEAERIGFNSFWVMDHFHQIQYVGHPNEPMLEQRIATRYKGVPEPMLREMMTYGGPEEIRRQLELFRDAGVQLFIMSFEHDRQLDELKLFGSEVAKYF